MQLQFANKHIYFALDSIWDSLDYKFKYHVNELITANSDDEFVQTIDVPEDLLVQIFSSVTVLPEGVAAYTNAAMLQVLSPQLQNAANMEAVQAGTEEPNEAARVLIAIQQVDATNASMRDKKTLTGKNKILS